MLKRVAKWRRWVASLDREAWMRFLVALVGLAIAFSSAVLSSGFREEGNIIATAITASIALLTAGVVGVVIVPYLARRAAFERLHFTMKYNITREGGLYFFVCLVISVAALNTGNNLLFIIVAVMLAAVLVSGIFSTIMLLNLELDVLAPEHVFARQTLLARLAVRNHSRFPVFSVNVVPEKSKPKRQWKWHRVMRGLPLRGPSGKELRVPDLRLDRMQELPGPPSLLEKAVYFSFIPGRQTLFHNVELRFERRGPHRQNGFGFSTRFPFSFLNKTRVVPIVREILVLPAVGPTEQFLEVLPMIRGEFQAFVQGRGYDLYRIREYTPGDPARHMDWKASAKTSSMMVREFAREDERKLRIVFDNPAPGVLTPEQYESGVTLAASLAWHFGEGEAELSFYAPGYEGASEAIDFLKYLAVVNPEKGQLSLKDIPRTPAYNLILTSQSAKSAPSELWANSYFIFLGNKNA